MISNKLFSRRYVRFSFAMFVVCALVIAFATSAYAYSLHTWKLASKAASYKWGDRLQTSGSVIRNAWESADDDWYTASSVNFYYSSSSANVLNSISESSTTLYGRTTISHSNNTVTSFTANINAGNSNISGSNVARSTANHEFGHVLGIDDLTSGTAIMNTSRNRSSIYVPQQDDKDGITSIY